MYGDSWQLLLELRCIWWKVPCVHVRVDANEEAVCVYPSIAAYSHSLVLDAVHSICGSLGAGMHWGGRDFTPQDTRHANCLRTWGLTPLPAVHASVLVWTLCTGCFATLKTYAVFYILIRQALNTWPVTFFFRIFAGIWLDTQSL